MDAPEPPAQDAVETVVLAGWWRRVLATVVDAVVLGAVVLLIGAVAGTDSGGRTVLAIILGTAYAIGMVGARGRTVGNLVAGTRVRADDGRPRVGTGVALLRWLGQAVLAVTVIGGVLDVGWPLIDDRKQTLHDKLAATVVVRVGGWADRTV